MNPYAIFPHLNMQLGNDRAVLPRAVAGPSGLDLAISVLAYRWIGRAESLIDRIAGRARND